MGNNIRCSLKTTKEKKDIKASMAVLPIFSLEKLRQEDYKFKVSLGSIVRHLVKKTKHSMLRKEMTLLIQYQLSTLIGL